MNKKKSDFLQSLLSTLFKKNVLKCFLCILRFLQRLCTFLWWTSTCSLPVTQMLRRDLWHLFLYPPILCHLVLPLSTKVLIPCGFSDSLSNPSLIFSACAFGFCSFKSIRKILPGLSGAKFGMPGYFNPFRNRESVYSDMHI